MSAVLVLSPSLGTTAELFGPILPALNDFSVVVLRPTPATAARRVPDGDVTVASIGEATLAQLDAQGIASFSFCGVSLGGMVGMWIAAAAPDRVERLVLACTGAKLGAEADYRARAAAVRSGGIEQFAAGVRDRWFTPPFRRTAAADACLDMLLATSPEGYAACCEAVGQFDFRGELGRVRAPTLVVAGADDPLTPPAVVETLTSGIAGASVTTIDHAAHLACAEQPGAFGAAVLAHLTQEVPV